MADNQINMINLNEIFQDVKTDQIGRLLNETKDSKTCMWYLICALDGMNDNELLKLAGCTIPQIKEARSNYLMKKYRGNDPMFAEVQDLKNEVKEIVSENKINETEKIVYIAKTGKKYHLENCRTLRGEKEAIDLNEAIKNGYEVCKVCKPDGI